ncbi:phosphoadenosine phosphosulfate reductase [Rhodosalinus sp. K401]|uniref:phosphoadenosine phosphosulfate reductase n=1 Tax=Rhodosalinus sp. K401 TaxID=3239195 RepID=UPI003525AA1D
MSEALETPADTPAAARAEMRAALARIGAERGFYEEIGSEHSALFVEAGPTLIVTFENLDHVRDNAADRMPWGYGFVSGQGWSMLGLMAHGWTWYRDAAVFDFFDRLRDAGFFDRFERVVFYGASMGGYAACVFSAAAPGATVIAISPQATLSREVASWETRYHRVWRRDFTGRYGFAPEMTAAARRVHLFFDPSSQLDAMHAALFQGGNVRKFYCRHMGHRIASLWLRLGILKPVVLDCVENRLTPLRFYRHMRARRGNPRYEKELLRRIEARNRPCLVIRYCEAILARRRAPHFRKAMRAAQAELRRRGG